MRTILLALVLMGLITAAEQKQVQWQEARVVAQERVQNGEVAKASGFGMNGGASAQAMAVPIIDNCVTIETNEAQFKLIEKAPPPGSVRSAFHHALVVPVNGTVKFRRAGDDFILLDAEGREHKLRLVGMTARAGSAAASAAAAQAPAPLSRIEDRLLEPEFGYQQYRTGVPSWQAAKEVNDAMVALRAVHSDLDQMTGLMRVVMESLRPNWKGINVDEYLESLYAVSKYAGFSVAAREALAQREKAASQGK